MCLGSPVLKVLLELIKFSCNLNCTDKNTDDGIHDESYSDETEDESFKFDYQIYRSKCLKTF